MVSFLVCPNGSGHLKRVISIAIELANNGINSELMLDEITIKNLQYFKENMDEKYIHIKKVNINPYYIQKTKNFNVQIYLNELKLIYSTLSIKSRLLISDNIIPIGFNKNFIMMGSFLWPYVYSEKIKTNDEVELLREIEIKELQEKRPIILCNYRMYNHFLGEHCELVKIPWIDEQKNRNHSDTISNILFSFGTSDYKYSSLIEKILEIEDSKYCFYLSQSSLTDDNSSKFLSFDHSNSSWQKIDLVICRPGIGIITDSFSYSIPVIAIYDSNTEIEHNSQIIKENHLGDSISVNGSIKKIFKKIEMISNKYKFYSETISNEKFNGAKVACKFIMEKY